MRTYLVPIYTAQTEHQGYTHFAVALTNILTGKGIRHISCSTDSTIRRCINYYRRMIFHRFTLFLNLNPGNCLPIHQWLSKMTVHTQGKILFVGYHLIKYILRFNNIKATTTYRIAKFLVNPTDKNLPTARFRHVNEVKLPQGIKSTQSSILTNKQGLKPISCRTNCSANPFGTAIHHNAIVRRFYLLCIGNFYFLASFRYLRRRLITTTTG